MDEFTNMVAFQATQNKYDVRVRLWTRHRDSPAQYPIGNQPNTGDVYTLGDYDYDPNDPLKLFPLVDQNGDPVEKPYVAVRYFWKSNRDDVRYKTSPVYESAKPQILPPLGGGSNSNQTPRHYIAQVTLEMDDNELIRCLLNMNAMAVTYDFSDAELMSEYA